MYGSICLYQQRGEIKNQLNSYQKKNKSKVNWKEKIIAKRTETALELIKKNDEN